MQDALRLSTRYIFISAVALLTALCAFLLFSSEAHAANNHRSRLRQDARTIINNSTDTRATRNETLLQRCLRRGRGQHNCFQRASLEGNNTSNQTTNLDGDAVTDDDENVTIEGSGQNNVRTNTEQDARTTITNTTSNTANMIRNVTQVCNKDGRGQGNCNQGTTIKGNNSATTNTRIFGTSSSKSKRRIRIRP